VNCFQKLFATQPARSYKLNQNKTGDIMAQTTVDKFVQAVKKDPSSIAKLKAAVDIESYYQIAEEHGYHFTPEELHSELSKQSLEELAMKINPGLYHENT
jgi:predicted ribosomally synthesized peptide with nif11-like leader